MESLLRVPEPPEEGSTSQSTEVDPGLPPVPRIGPLGRIEGAPVEIPAYLREVYSWAYLNPLGVRLLDRPWVVNAILWGNNHRLQRWLFEEIKPGWHVLQACCVYGDLSPGLAQWLGPAGRLEVIDVAPIQVSACRNKLRGYPWATVRLADAAAPGGGPYDAVVCFFLLHELPEHYKHAVVDALLGRVLPGGKIIFIDYHKPVWAHPLKWITAGVFALLEPFAKSLWRHRIADFASRAWRFTWRGETAFGGLFQKTVAQRITPPAPSPPGL